jgi:glutamate racemase
MNAPLRIGMMDSGVGGLSVLREVRALLPEHPVLYLADSAWCPYGNKPPRAIRSRVLALADHLVGEGCGIVVVACNSATIHGVELLRATYPIPFVGMEPAVKPAAERTRSGVIGVLATEASIAGEKFHRLIHTHAPGVTVITRPCPRFVELVEAGILDGPEAEDAVREAVEPLLDGGADVLVLGCTHYPFLRPVLERFLPPGVTLLDTGPAVARRVAALLGAKGAAAPGEGPAGELVLETSGCPEDLERLLPLLLPGISWRPPVRRLPGFSPR